MPKKSSSAAAKYAKSSKRKKGKKKSPSQALAQRAASSTPTVSQRPVVASGAKSALPASAYALARDTTTEYSYVVKELQKIGIIAGLMFAIIVILAFFLR
jgi:hypothetical protein